MPAMMGMALTMLAATMINRLFNDDWVELLNCEIKFISECDWSTVADLGCTVGTRNIDGVDYNSVDCSHLRLRLLPCLFPATTEYLCALSSRLTFN